MLSLYSYGKLLNILINSMERNEFEDTKGATRIFVLFIQLQCTNYNVIVIENNFYFLFWKFAW
jgi:hypothetical protein